MAADLTQRGGARVSKEGHDIGLGVMDMTLLGQVLSMGGTVPRVAAHIGPRLLVKTKAPVLVAYGCVVTISCRWG